MAGGHVDQKQVGPVADPLEARLWRRQAESRPVCVPIVAIERIHIAPFVYPAGWAYRRWAVGAVLPPLFLVRDYWHADWATLGLAPPEPGFQWVRYGPDLLLINVTTGLVVDVAYDVFY